MQGKEIGEYYIKGYLKQGGYGKVYLAQSINKNLYALKHIEHGKQEKQYVIKEADRYKKLDHPNIVKMVEYFEDPKKEDHMAIVLEYCSKKDLSECLLNDKDFLEMLNKQRSIKILKEITDGLVYLHQKNIIHRDIKPCNILMTEDYLPKIGDLGSSKDTQKSLNTGNNVNGTLTYLAPEVCDEKYKQDQYTSKTDVWSLGIIALELLLKKKSSTFVNPYCPAAMQKGFPSEILLNEIEDKPFRQLVRKMLTKDPKQRLTSIEVLHALQAMKEALKKVNKCFISLHKAIIQYPITLREVFDHGVNEETGKFGVMQFRELMSSIDKTLQLEEIQQVFSLIDLNDSDTIEYDELNRHYCQVNGLPYSEEKLKRKGITDRQKFQGERNVFPPSEQSNQNSAMKLCGGCNKTNILKQLQFCYDCFQKYEKREDIYQETNLNQVNEQKFIHLLKTKQFFPHLKNISFRDINRNQGLKALAENGHKFPSLKFIDLKFNQITDEGLKALVENGNKFPSLQSISLLNNQITDEGLKALVENGHKFLSLITLNLHNNQITGKGLTKLVENGHKFLSLNEIDFWNNHINDEGLTALVENGHKFPSLQKIRLWQNKITVQGLRALVENGHKFPSMNEISLQDNPIKDRDLKRLEPFASRFKYGTGTQIFGFSVTKDRTKLYVFKDKNKPSQTFLVRI